jgi:membrane protease YdiL (CAAX protease family)
MLPVLFIVKGCGYNFQSLGFKRERSRTAIYLFIISVTSISLGATIRIVANPNRLLLLLEADVSSFIIASMAFQWFVVALPEELVFRGIIQSRLGFHFRSRVIGICIASSVFAGFHVLTVLYGSSSFPGDIGFALLNALLTRLFLAIIFGILWEHSESILPSWILHSVNNSWFVVIVFIGLA